MAASPSTVISEGFGTFGSVNLLITDGYGIGTPVSSAFIVFIDNDAAICRSITGNANISRSVENDAAICRTVSADTEFV